MRIAEGKPIGNLRDIELALPQQGFCLLNFQPRIVPDNAVSRGLLKHRAQIRAAVIQPGADLLYRQIVIQMLLQKLNDCLHQMAVQCVLRRKNQILLITAHQQNQKLL